jgi:hypothetical protein
LDDRVRNVFCWLDAIRARPALYLRDNSLRELQTLVSGYFCALHEHGIVEGVPDFGKHFNDWLRHRTYWSTCRGWAVEIEERQPTAAKRLEAFFEYVDEFRNLRPSRICTVKLAARHNPTGQRIVIGMKGRMRKPTRVDVMRYRPEPLHFLRFHYGKRVENDYLLMTGSGSHVTDIRLAKQWVKEELQVELTEWQAETGRRRTKRRT